MDYRQLAKEYIESMQLPGKSRQLKGFGDIHSDTAILLYIDHRGEVLPKDISDAMAVSSARIAIALNNLAKKGFITREIDNNDRRRIIVKMTPNGREFSIEQRLALIDRAAKFFEELGEHDAREFVRIMGRIAAMMRKKSS